MLKEPKYRKRIRALWERLRSGKGTEWLLYGAAAVAALLLFFSSFLPKNATDKGKAAEAASVPALDAEARLREVLGRIRGAGNVDVMITYETGAELVMAMSTDVNTNEQETSDGGKTSRSEQTTESSTPALVGGSGGEPVVLMQKEPVVRGVIVVADGAADVRVRLDLQRAVRAVLDVPVSRIEVFERADTPE